MVRFWFCPRGFEGRFWLILMAFVCCSFLLCEFAGECPWYIPFPPVFDLNATNSFRRRCWKRVERHGHLLNCDDVCYDLETWMVGASSHLSSDCSLSHPQSHLV